MTTSRMYIEVCREYSCAAFFFDEGVEYSPEPIKMKAALAALIQKLKTR